ncbi:MAG: hypothetical protein AB7E05_04965 [Sphingobium sp.]
MRHSAAWPTAAMAAASLIAAAGPAAHAQGGKATATTPQLDYQMDGYRDERLTYDSAPEGYRQPAVSTVPGQPVPVPAVAGAPPAAALPSATSVPTVTAPATTAAASTPTPAPPPTPPTKPDPAYIGSGMIVNGWYYPPPQVTTIVTEYGPAR